VDHLISGCSYLVQSHYKSRHDQVASLVHWQLCKSVGINVVGNWWNHTPERVVSNSICKDYTIVTDRHLRHKRPDTVLSYLQQNLIDISIPGDSRMVQKSVEKLTKYRDLHIEVDKCSRHHPGLFLS